MKPWGVCLRLLLCASFGCVAAASSYEPAPFSHYQPILDRMPFGALPPAVNPNASADLEAQKTAEEEKMEQQKVAQMLSFSALNVTPRGTTAVGFTDRSVNPPESYYLEVGASAHGWSIPAADYAGNWAQFEKDGVTITMHLDKGLIDGPPAAGTAPVAVAGTANAPPAAAPPPAPAAAPSSASIPGLVRRSSPIRPAASVPPPGTADTAAATAKPYLERLRERRAQEHAKERAAENATRESLQEIARKIAQDELAKREQESAAVIEELRLRQELQTAEAAEQERLREEEQKAAQEPEPEQDPAPGQEN